MEKKSTQSVIPQGELRCVWMDAGILKFKLCDQEFRCESCELNETIQKQKQSKAEDGKKEMPVVRNEERSMTADAIFKNTLKIYLDGLRKVDVPQDRHYNRSNYWVQENENGDYRIGINHILSNFFRPILGIVVSKAPLNIQKNDPFCWIVLPGGAITLRSPLDATISKFNPALQLKPNLLSTAPFDDGWIMEVSAKNKSLSGFVPVQDSQQHADRTLRNIEHSFSHAYRHHHPTAGTTLFDGGIRIENIENILDPKVYLDVINRIVHTPV